MCEDSAAYFYRFVQCFEGLNTRKKSFSKNIELTALFDEGYIREGSYRRFILKVHFYRGISKVVFFNGY